jgi:hypothetical protein
MSSFGDKLEQLKTDIENSETPQPFVTRSFEHFDTRGDKKLKDGVWTIVNKGGGSFNSPVDVSLLEGGINIILLYQFRLADNVKGIDIEEEEFKAYDKLINIIDAATGSTHCFDIEGFQQSMQIERPYGWIAISLTWKEFD